MMTPDEKRRAIRTLLDLAEDYFRDGFRRDRPQVEDAGGEGEAGLDEHQESPEGAPDFAGLLTGASSSSGAGEDAEAATRSGTPTGVGAAIAGAVAEAGAAAGMSLGELVAAVSVCERCSLGKLRKNAVPGEGVSSPIVLAVGEAPGAEEDATGRPFVGAAGKYLDKWLAAIGLNRKTNCYIANVIKCRPPQNRNPAPDEIAACRGYLERQVELLKPRAILALGRFAAQALTSSTRGINELRTGTHEYRGIPLVATFHPSAVLREPSLRQPVWDDLRRLKALIGDV